MTIKADIKTLVVDDMPVLRKLMTRMLRELGLTNVETAEDGQSAWGMIQNSLKNEKPYEFIISDWNMPNMTGLDLLKVVRRTPGMEKVPFLMITAENEKDNVVNAVSAGVSNFIIKPFSPQILKEKIDRIFTTKA
jgi:two-component system chemotaxis response regulator CheY